MPYGIHTGLKCSRGLIAENEAKRVSNGLISRQGPFYALVSEPLKHLGPLFPSPSKTKNEMPQNKAFLYMQKARLKRAFYFLFGCARRI